MRKVNKIAGIISLWLGLLLAAGNCRAEEGGKEPCPPVSDFVRMYQEGDVVAWYQATKGRGYTDDQIRDGFIWNIDQPDKEPGKRKGWVAVRAADTGMDLFREDPLLEKAVLGAQLNPEVYERAPNLAAAAARFGSQRLIGEFRRAGFGTPSFDAAIAQREGEGGSRRGSGAPRGLSPPETGFPNNPDNSGNPNPGSHVDQDDRGLRALGPGTGWIFAVLGVIAIIAGVIWRRKISRGWLVGIILFAAASLILAGIVLLSRRPPARVGANTTPEPPDRHQAVFSDIPRPRHVEIPPSHQKMDVERVKEDEYLKRVGELMRPYSVIDSPDRGKMDAERANAARQLMDLLDQGRPDFVKETRWNDLIRSVITLQQQSEGSMVHCMEMVKRWIADMNRKPGDAVAALLTMAAWEPEVTRPADRKDFERATKIADMQISLLPRVSGDELGTLLGSLTSAHKAIQDGKEQKIQTVLPTEKAAALVRESIGRFPEDVGLQRILASVVANRVQADPASLVAFGPILRDMVGNDEVGDFQRLSGYRAISSSGQLPSWANDTEIARYLEVARKRQPELSGTRFANSLAMEISEARIHRTSGADRDRYGKMLLEIAGDSSGADSSIRLRSLRTVVNLKIILPEEVIAKFGDDPSIGAQVMRDYSKK